MSLLTVSIGNEVAWNSFQRIVVRTCKQHFPTFTQQWELSRFAASPAQSNSPIDGTANTRYLLAATVKIAAEYGVKRLITVSPLGVERLLLRLDMHAHRAGPPMLVDGKPIFACWIEIDQQTLDALELCQRQ